MRNLVEIEITFLSVIRNILIIFKTFFFFFFALSFAGSMTLSSLFLENHKRMYKLESLQFQRRNWQPTPKFLPEELHGQRSLAGYSPCVHNESDRTELQHTHKLQF